MSQFTLYADTRRGRRPGFTDAADAGPRAVRCGCASRPRWRSRACGPQLGEFGAEMAVELVNDGPFTIWLDTPTGPVPITGPRDEAPDAGPLASQRPAGRGLRPASG